MVVAMFIGMGVFAPLWTLAFALFDSNAMDRTDVMAMTMATDMVIGMSLWMWFRGHGALPGRGVGGRVFPAVRGAAGPVGAGRDRRHVPDGRRARADARHDAAGDAVAQGRVHLRAPQPLATAPRARNGHGEPVRWLASRRADVHGTARRRRPALLRTSAPPRRGARRAFLAGRPVAAGDRVHRGDPAHGRAGPPARQRGTGAGVVAVEVGQLDRVPARVRGAR